MNVSAQAKFTKARSALILDQPFFGSLALRLKVVEDNSMPTMAVDGKHIFYNSSFVEMLSLAHVKFVVAHEVMHCVWQHIGRCGPRVKPRYYAAADYVINAMLKRVGFDMPEMGLYNKDWDGPEWTADAIYPLLPDNTPMWGMAGGAMDELRDGTAGVPQDASERTALDREWKIATIQAANAAKACGQLPSEIERFLGDLMKPQVNWVERLRNFINETTRNDYDWRRPSKRHEDVYVPSLFDESMGDIAVVVDDSGSIGDATLAVFGAEIKAIMEDCRPHVTHLMYCDASVSAHYELSPDDPLELKCHGGGGTDFAPPFNMLEEKQIVPKCLVYLTDLCGPCKRPEPGYPVMWVCVTSAVAPWGETVHIDDYDKLEKH